MLSLVAIYESQEWYQKTLKQTILHPQKYISIIKQSKYIIIKKNNHKKNDKGESENKNKELEEEK